MLLNDVEGSLGSLVVVVVDVVVDDDGSALLDGVESCSSKIYYGLL